VTLEGEDVLAGPEDALDALADRREVRSLAGLVFAVRSEDRGVQFADFGCELASGVALVADQGHSTLPAAAGKQLQCDLALALLGQRECSGCSVGRKDGVQPEPPEKRL
jgi:hypothetical protein